MALMNRNPFARRARTLLAGAAGVVLTLSTAAAIAPPASALDPMFGAPEVGQCYQVSAPEAEASSTEKDTVSCAKAHRLQVFAVFKVPGSTPLKGPKLDAFTTKRCYPAAAKLFGDGGQKYTLSAYTGAYRYVPTKEQQKEGAHWVSCLAGVYGGFQGGGVHSALPGLAVTKGKVGKVTGRLAPNRRFCAEIIDGEYAPSNCASSSHRVAAFTVLSGPSARRSDMAMKFCERRVGKQPNWGWSWRSFLTSRSKFTVACHLPK